MKTYNGHKNWNHWNVSLWIGNDEPLYRLALNCISSAANKKSAAENMMLCLRNAGIIKTPDGAPYSVSSIQAAMRGLE